MAPLSASLAALLIAGASPSPDGGSPMAHLESLLHLLADPGLTGDQKRALEEQILGAGREALEVLIAHVGDRRVYDREQRIMNLNLLIDAPAHLPLPEPQTQEVVVTLGARCDWLLRRLITPPGYRSKYAGNFKPREVGYDSYLFRVADWPAWWKRQRGKKLEQLREEMKPVVDAYWKEKGVEQLVH